MEAELPCSRRCPAAAPGHSICQADGALEFKLSPGVEEEPRMFEALQESNVESTFVDDTHRFELGGIYQFSSPEGHLHDEPEDLEDILRQTSSPITTETDIDITAGLLPSGGIQSHHHAVKTAVSETGLPEAQGYKSCFHNEFCNIHSDSDDCGFHSCQLFLHPNFPQHCPDQSSFVMSTVPFSFGNNLKSAFLQQEPLKCNEDLKMQYGETPVYTEVGETQKIHAPIQFFQSDESLKHSGVKKIEDEDIYGSIDPDYDSPLRCNDMIVPFFQSNEESLKHSGVKKIEDEDIYGSIDPDYDSPLRCNDMIVPIMCSNSETEPISLSDIYDNHIFCKVGECSDTQKIANIQIASCQEDLYQDMVTNETEENLECEIQSSQIVELGKQFRNENVSPVTSSLDELQQYPEKVPMDDPLKSPSIESFGMQKGSESSTTAFKTSQEDPEVEEEVVTGNKCPGDRQHVHTKRESKLEEAQCTKGPASGPLQFCDSEGCWPEQLVEVGALSNLCKYTTSQNLEDNPEKSMPLVTVQNVPYKCLSFESREPMAESIDQAHHHSDQQRHSNQYEDSLEDHFNLSVGARGFLSVDKTDQISAESIEGNHVLNPRVLDADSISEKAGVVCQSENILLAPRIPEQDSAIWVKDTDPMSRPRNADTLRIAISPARLHHEEVTSVSAEPLSHQNVEANELAQLASEILTKTSVQDAYGRIIKERGQLFMEALRKTFLEAADHHFTLVDSGIILSRCEEGSNDTRNVFVTMWNGTKLVMSTPRSSLFPYYHMGIHFYITENLSENWYRVKDRVTQESMLMKKVPVISNWKKFLHNFLTLPHHPFQLVPFAVLYDRNGNILYLMEDRNVLAVGASPDGFYPDRGKLLSKALNYLGYCKRNNIYPGDGGTMIYTAQGVCFDPSGLTNYEDPCVFKKTVQRILRLLLFETQEQDPAVESLVDSVCQLLEEDTEWSDPIWWTGYFFQEPSRPGAFSVQPAGQMQFT